MKCVVFLWLFLSISSLTASASGSKEPRIILGEEADETLYPGFVVISIVGYRTCGGVLVSENVVMTAGHCLEIDGFNFASLTSEVGVLQVGRGRIRLRPYTGEFLSAEETSAVKRIILHPNYKFISMHEVKNDIALLVLEEKFDKPFTEIAQKIPDAGSIAIAIGLGLNNDFSWPGPDGQEIGSPRRLYQVELTVGDIGQNPCPLAFDGAHINSTTSICAYGKAVKGGFPSICWGDSGGPLFDEDGNVIGIVSWEPDACTLLTTPFNIFTRVPYYKKSFIDPVIKKYDK
jgi:secreted trypsin-like serine protease